MIYKLSLTFGLILILALLLFGITDGEEDVPEWVNTGSALVFVMCVVAEAILGFIAIWK
jgi:hypothetical protein